MAYILCGGTKATVTIDGVEVENDLALVSDGGIDESVSTLPYNFHTGDAVVYTDELYILGGFVYPTKNSKYNG